MSYTDKPNEHLENDRLLHESKNISTKLRDDADYILVEQTVGNFELVKKPADENLTHVSDVRRFAMERSDFMVVCAFLPERASYGNVNGSKFQVIPNQPDYSAVEESLDIDPEPEPEL